MLKPNNELMFSMSDLYPNFGGVDTSTLANPEPDDQEALNEDVQMAEESSQTYTGGKKIFLAIGVLVGLIILFGGK